ncbi:MAG TPA: hypothetical protein VJJ52_06225 [Candidatus Nanoarchaeia archaeon]|nr:hypothetical protein [Candidatus Nanoarchaeia archaeon]
MTPMKRSLVVFLALALVIITVACTQKSANVQESPGTAEVTEGSADDSFGNGIDNMNNDENDISSQQLEGMDQGLSDVQNI